MIVTLKVIINLMEVFFMLDFSSNVSAGSTSVLSSLGLQSFRNVYDSETGHRICVPVKETGLDDYLQSDENLDRVIEVVTARKKVHKRFLAEYRDCFNDRKDDVVGAPIYFVSDINSDAPLSSTSSEVKVTPETSNNLDEGYHQDVLHMSSSMLAFDFFAIKKGFQNIINKVRAGFMSGTIEAPTLSGRVMDLGVDELKALALSVATTTAASTLIESASILAWTGPAAEKIVFLASGYVKFKTLCGSRDAGTLLLGSCLMATPNILADLIFHDSIYTQLASAGLEAGYPGVILLPVSYTVALAAAIMLQYATYKMAFGHLEKWARNS